MKFSPYVCFRSISVKLRIYPMKTNTNYKFILTYDSQLRQERNIYIFLSILVLCKLIIKLVGIFVYSSIKVST